MTATTKRLFQNVVIRASAGTGKTFQLTNRFIGLVAAAEPLDTILATTFTRKAAGEILDRVLFRLAEASLDAEKLSQLAQHAGDATLDRGRCLAILRGMVHGLHRIRVSTLDSFFIQVARSFSLELGLLPGWQIVDAPVDRRIRDEAIRAVLEKQPTGDVLSLMHMLTKGQASRSISGQIGSLVDDLYSDYLEAPPEAWEALVRPKPLEQAELRAAIEFLAAVELPPDKRFQKARLQDLDRAQNGQWEAFIGKGLAARIISGDESYYKKPIPIDVIVAYETIVRHATAVLVGQIANQTEASRKLLDHFDEAYQRLKLTQRALRFEDVTRMLTRGGVSDRLDEIVYRLDAHVSHLLLDEFQDTSPLQWRVLRPFARRIVEPGGRESFFCVGDVKQAIYGWRGGVAEIFEAIESELARLVPQELNRSWRSCQPVIDTVNRVFENIGVNPVLEKHSDAAGKWAARFDHHTTARTELSGHCRMIVAPGAEETENQTDVTLAFAADRVAEIHRASPGMTIGVLVRRNAAVARLIYELRQRKIHASEEGGNPLTDSAAVQLILSLLTLADHPGDATAAFHVATSPLAEHLEFAQFDDSAAVWRLSQQIRSQLMDTGYGPTIRSWVVALAAECDERELNRLVQLVEVAYAYESDATTRADDFVSLIRQHRVEDPTSADVRVMTVHQAKGLQFEIVVLPELDMKLTGQTPPMVFDRPGPTEDIRRVCRYVGKDLRPLLSKSFNRMFDEHHRLRIEESLCVLYVALTRAIHGLEIIIDPSKSNEKTLPTSSAGVLRSALSDGVKAEPESVLYEHGNPAWYAESEKGPIPARQPSDRADKLDVSPYLPRLAKASARPSRGLERASPSGLEGGPKIDLRHRLRLDTGRGLDWGTAMHACFEQIGWLEDGLPEDAALERRILSFGLRNVDVHMVIERFHKALDEPEIRASLSRATYQRSTDGKVKSAVHAAPHLADPRWTVSQERPFAVLDGETILRGSIDRLVVLYDGDRPVAADVIDFKTDAVGRDDDALQTAVDTYRPQLAAYRRAVISLFGLPPDQVSSRLLFVGAGLVVSV